MRGKLMLNVDIYIQILAKLRSQNYSSLPNITWMWKYIL